MAEFSGGWRMRAALAAALFAEPDLLLLDEPTNFLDLEGALWLEARLKRHPSTALVISHDRELLDRSMDYILHLGDGKLTLYPGGFAAFERQRAERLRAAGRDAGQDRGPARAPADLRRPLPRRHQGAPGPVAAEDDRAAGRDPAGGRGDDGALHPALARKAAAAAADAAGEGRGRL